jgi:glycine/D-amino acid oxidase-like deaminating enzyme
MRSTADVVICGAGIAGAAAAYHLAVPHRVPRVVIVDERDPMTLTSDKGTQGYRNWWPGPDDTMLRLVSRSIDLLEDSAAECGNTFRLSRRGYVFATADEAQAARLLATANQVSAHGMGSVRIHPGAEPYRPANAEGYADQPVGADLLRGSEVHRAYPYLAPEAIAALHIRRAGWVNAVALGSWFLSQAMAAGATFVRGRVTGVDSTGGNVREIQLGSGDTIATDRFVIAAGPGFPNVAGLLGITLPVFHELHAKMTMRDPLGVVRRDAPFLIWTDETAIEWTDEERRELETTEKTARLARTLPGGVHVRPVDLTHGDELYFIWTFETEKKAYAWPPSFDPRYGEVVLRGAVRMIPGLAKYVAQRPRAVVDGGYYCKTPENRPLIGPLPVKGAFVLGALSGMGVMSSHASAELLAAHVVGDRLPDYARWFLPSRYDDPSYRTLVDQWGPLAGQL